MFLHRWVHAAFTFDGHFWSVYLNGTLACHLAHTVPLKMSLLLSGQPTQSLALATGLYGYILEVLLFVRISFNLRTTLSTPSNIPFAMFI